MLVASLMQDLEGLIKGAIYGGAAALLFLIAIELFKLWRKR
jgi:hypothetical protein